MEGPLPPSSVAPSTWYADVATPIKKFFGKRRFVFIQDIIAIRGARLRNLVGLPSENDGLRSSPSNSRGIQSMPDAFRPSREDRFTFGLWTVGNRGRDPFGDAVRPAIPLDRVVSKLGELGAYGVNLHDND